MVLKTVDISVAKKTAHCAVTYRSGAKSIEDTCPDSCALKTNTTNTTEIDPEYEKAIRQAVPKRGISWLFTHFHPNKWGEPNSEGKTVFNYSCDTLIEAIKFTKQGIASVTVVPEMLWGGKKSIVVDGVRLVRCYDEYTKAGCRRCGNGKPWCAMKDRTFAIGFTGHGNQKAKAIDPTKKGGCYAFGGHVGLHWRKLQKQKQKETDGKKLLTWVKTLLPYTMVRHHIAGDLGKEV